MLLPWRMGPVTGLSPDPYPYCNVDSHCNLYGSAADSHLNRYLYAHSHAAAHAHRGAHADDHADAHRDRDGDPDGHRDGDTHSDGNDNANADPDWDSDGDRYPNTDADWNGDRHAHPNQYDRAADRHTDADWDAHVDADRDPDPCTHFGGGAEFGPARHRDLDPGTGFCPSCSLCLLLGSARCPDRGASVCR